MITATGARSGFGLTSVLIALVIVAALTVAALMVYMELVTREARVSGPADGPPVFDSAARLAEGQLLANSVMSALTACAQAKGAGQQCSLDEVVARAGLNPSTYTTADGRWQVVSANLTFYAGGIAAMTGHVAVSGVTGNAAGLSLTVFHTGAGLLVRCNPASATPPAGPSDGQAC
jgi:Tfp pilus assembly protein PilE